MPFTKSCSTKRPRISPGSPPSTTSSTAPPIPKEGFLIDALVANEWRLSRVAPLRSRVSGSTPGNLFIVKSLDTASGSIPASAPIAAPSKSWNPKWGRRYRLPTPVPVTEARAEPGATSATPRNPKNPNPLPRPQLRSVTILKPHLPQPRNIVRSAACPPQAPTETSASLTSFPRRDGSNLMPLSGNGNRTAEPPGPMLDEQIDTRAMPDPKRSHDRQE
jgi:hypothetical protein